MTLLDLTCTSLVPAAYDPETGRLDHSESVVVEEAGVRRLADMPGFFPENALPGDLELYQMYNGVYRKEHQALFARHRLKYEYTMISALTIGGECNKTHGHIHVHRDGLARGMGEVYEVLHGEGVFLMFTLDPDERASVIVLHTRPGDRFMIPPRYYHLTVNTGTEPFIFGDLISMDTRGDYGLLKERNGAPIKAFREGPGICWKTNPAYGPLRDVRFVTTADLDWEPRLPDAPLYAAFLADPERFHFLHGVQGEEVSG